MNPSVSFTDFVGYKKEVVEEIKKNQVQDEIDTSVDLVAWVHKLNTLGEPIEFIKKYSSTLQILPTTFSIDNYLSVILVGLIYPKVYQTPTRFNVTFTGHVKILLNDQVMLDSTCTIKKTESFEYTFSSGCPLNILCSYKTLEQAANFELVCSSNNIDDYIPKCCHNDTHCNFTFYNLINPLGLDLSVYGKVKLNGDIECVNQVKVNDIHCSGKLILTKQKDSDENSCTLEYSNNNYTILTSPGIILSSTDINLGQVNLTDNKFTHDLGFTFCDNDKSILSISSDNVTVSSDLIVNKSLELNGSLKLNTLHIGTTNEFENGSFQYPDLGKCNIIGTENSHNLGPHLNLLLQYTDTPLFQIKALSYNNICINFDCFYNEQGTLVSTCDSNLQIIKKDGSLDLKSNQTSILEIDLFSQQVTIFKDVEFMSNLNLSSDSCITFTSIDATTAPTATQIGTTPVGTFYVKNDTCDKNLLELNNLGELGCSSIQLSSSLNVFNKFQVNDNNITLCKDTILSNNTTLKCNNTRDIDLLTGDASISTMGGMFVNKSLNVKQSISTKYLSIIGQTPCILLDSTDKLAYSIPLLGTGGIGAKIILSKAPSLTTTDAAIGTNTNSIWYSMYEPSIEYSQEWYFGKVKRMSIDGVGNFRVDGQDNVVSFNGLAQGIYLNSTENFKPVGIFLNNKFSIGSSTNSTDFEIKNLNNTLLTINDDHCTITCDVHLQSSCFIPVLSISKDLHVGDTLLINEYSLSSNNRKIIEWNTDSILLNHNIISLFGKKISIEANDIIVHNVKGKQVLHVNDSKSILDSDLQVLDVYAKNVHSDSIVSSSIESSIAKTSDLYIDNIHSLNQDLNIQTRNLNITSTTCNIDYLATTLVHVDKLLVKEKLSFENGQCTSFNVCGQKYNKWMYIGKLNTTDSGFGFNEKGEYYLDITCNMHTLDVFICIKDGILQTRHSTRGDGDYPTSNIYVYTDKLENFHVFIHCLANVTTFVKVNSTVASNCVDEGTSDLPNGYTSKFSKDYKLAYTSDISTATCNLHVNLLYSNSIKTSGDVHVRGKVVNTGIIFDDTGNTNSNDSSSEYSISIKEKPIVSFSDSLVKYSTSIIGVNDIGSNVSRWNNLYVKNVDTNNLHVISTSRFDNDVKITKLILDQGVVTDLEVNGNSTFDTLFIKRDLVVGKCVTIKDKFTVQGDASFSECFIKKLNIFGNLHTSSGIISTSPGKSINVYSKDFRLTSLRTGGTRVEGTCGLNLDNNTCTLFSTTNDIYLSPGNVNKLVQISANGNIVFGKNNTGESSLSPIVNFKVYGTMNVVNQVVFEKDLQVSDIYCQNISVKNGVLYSGEIGASTSKVIEKCNGILKLYPSETSTTSVTIDSNLGISCTSLSTETVNTQLVQANDIKTTRLHTTLFTCNSLVLNGSDSNSNSNSNSNSDSDSGSGSSFVLESSCLLLKCKDSENNGIFQFQNNGEFLVDKVTTKELQVLSTIETTHISIDGILKIGGSESVIQLKDSSVLSIENNKGDVCIYAAGQKGIIVSQTTGNINLSGQLIVNSGLDLYTTGKLDLNSAALQIKGGASIQGSLSVGKFLVLGNLQLTCGNNDSQVYSLELPSKLPELTSVLTTNINGECTWTSLDEMKHHCEHECIHECNSIQDQTRLTITGDQDALVVENGNTLLKSCVIQDSLLTGKLDNKGLLKSKTIQVGDTSVISGIIKGYVLIGSSKNNKTFIDITFENELPHNKYHIIGNVVSYGDTNGSIFVCTFKKLTNKGCVVVIKDIESDVGWSDLTVSLHYIVTF